MKILMFTFLAVTALAATATGNIPDLTLSSIGVADEAVGASVYVRPDAAGPPFTEAFAAGGSIVDGTIILTLIGTDGEPVVHYPFEDTWLEFTGGLVLCAEPPVLHPIANTDENGQTFWVHPVGAGGGGLTVVGHAIVAGAPLVDVLDELHFNSADMNGSHTVDLTDIAYFVQAIAEYDYQADFNYDGVINLVDIVRFTQAIGSFCQP